MLDTSEMTAIRVEPVDLQRLVDALLLAKHRAADRKRGFHLRFGLDGIDFDLAHPAKVLPWTRRGPIAIFCGQYIKGLLGKGIGT